MRCQGQGAAVGLWLLPLLLCFAPGAVAVTSRLSMQATALAKDFLFRERPVTKVVKLLQDMQQQLAVEEKEDQDTYDKLACWCETNDKSKTKAIADGTQKASELVSSIDANTASAASLRTEISSLETEVAKLQTALEKADAIREKESKAFHAEEKDMITSIASLKGAVNALAKHHPQGASLIQMGEQREALIQVSHVLRRRHVRQRNGDAGPLMLLQQPEQQPVFDIDALLQQQGGAGYQPASGGIFGILNQMKETFEQNLETSRREEAQAAQSFADVKAAKTQEVAASSDKIFTKKEEFAQATNAAARDKEDLEDTREQLEADTSLLSDLKVKCQKIDQGWEDRQKSRKEEIKAVGETINILTEDEARDTFGRALGFIQANSLSRVQSENKGRALAHLRTRARSLGSRRLMYLAARMRNDAFNKVKESIERMAGQLATDQADEVGKKDHCVGDINTNDKQTSQKKDVREDLEVEINSLEHEIGSLNDEEQGLRQRIADSQIELKRASENRENENKDFQMTLADQRATQEILRKAVARMKEFYGKPSGAASFLQLASRSTARQEPPAEMEPYKAHAGSGGVIALLENIINRSKEVERDALSAENDAQAAYEDFVKLTNAEIATMMQQITNDDEIIAKDRKLEVQDRGDKDHIFQVLERLAAMLSTLHADCDFTLKNFSTRQQARQQEIEALRESKAIFSAI